MAFAILLSACLHAAFSRVSSFLQYLIEQYKIEIMTEEKTAHIIHEMVERIAQKFNPDKIILFGSYARGTAGPDSDIDLLVVIPVNGSKRKLAMEIDMAISDRKVPVDLIVIRPEEIDRFMHMVGTIIRPAIREGVVLYERAA
jgi:predicted nucleotidyltransferase